jgi:hypothetical protein
MPGILDSHFKPTSSRILYIQCLFSRFAQNKSQPLIELFDDLAYLPQLFYGNWCDTIFFNYWRILDYIQLEKRSQIMIYWHGPTKKLKTLESTTLVWKVSRFVLSNIFVILGVSYLLYINYLWKYCTFEKVFCHVLGIRDWIDR